MPCKNGIYCQRSPDCQDLTCPGRPTTHQEVMKEQIKTNTALVVKSIPPPILDYNVKLTLFDRFKLLLGVTTLIKIIENKHKP